MWAALERATDRTLLVKTGLLQVGAEAGAIIEGILRSGQEHELALELLPTTELVAGFPVFILGIKTTSPRFESVAGFLKVELCVQSFIEQAQIWGDHLVPDRVNEVTPDRDGYLIRTNAGRAIRPNDWSSL